MRFEIRDPSRESMSYDATRAAVMAGAASCVARGIRVELAGRLMTQEDVERAFAEWHETSGELALLRFRRGEAGQMVIELSPIGTDLL